MKNIRVGFVLLVIAIASCTHKKVQIIYPTNTEIDYMGRINFNNPDTAIFYWPGTSATLNFKGTSVSAVLRDEHGKNYYNVVIDNDSVYRFRTDSTKHIYILANNLSNSVHSITLFKTTEYDRGKTFFYGFGIPRKAKVLPKPRHEKSIEFFGNSITCGYAVEDTTGQDRPDSTYTNNYLSYAAITARYFNAGYTCTSKSGIGIMISWWPQIMSDIYYRLDPEYPGSRWDFKAKVPDLVVINLFQNDSWLVNMPDRAEFKNKFGTIPHDEDYIVASYANFLKSILNVYPATPIICALGSMDATREGSPWPGYIEKAVKLMNDSTISTFFFPYKNTPGHPNIAEQQRMADELTGYIHKKFGW